jgi:hypothetical protein
MSAGIGGHPVAKISGKAQMARVVRPGGRVVAAEPDWDTLVISSGDQQTTRAILDEHRASVRTRRA